MQAFKTVEAYISEAPYDVILSGPISGVPDFRERFARDYVRVRDEFRRAHGREARVWNPAALPQDRNYAWYMAACHAAIFASPGATLWQLEGWSDSPGSRSEHALALSLGLRVDGARPAVVVPEPERPDSFDFALDFIGSPEADDLLFYVEQLEAIARGKRA